MLIGVSSELVLIVSVLKIISWLIGILYSFFSVIVSGIIINSVILLVRKVESSVVVSIINIVSWCFVVKWCIILCFSILK